MNITKALLTWYDVNKRSFAFRGTKDPYAIWISEIMLQQTRTESAEGYYIRFLRQFPDVFSLAQAQEQQVLKAWEGLGYYTRARNLHKTAKIIAQRGGEFPDNAQELQTLPGIGPYTAAAIASIAYDQPLPAMDGNLSRVISRLYDIREDIAIPSVRRRLFELGEQLMPKQRAGDMNQALMDLGATICLPGTADCGRCPLNSFCIAYQEGEPERLPVLTKKKPPKEINLSVLLLHSEGRIFVTRRSEALLHGLCVFYLIEHIIDERDINKHLLSRHITPLSIEKLGTARHVFTHRLWQMTIYLVELAAPSAPIKGEWLSLPQLSEPPFPTAMRVPMEMAVRHLSRPASANRI
ncbi:MAG: A/G-specific adenine glycosylase [Clostridiales bacterium]|nr:A/G-specific adenine glycosylase [Clostridiales bacterium]